MSRTILNPEYANDLNGLFDGTGTIDTGSISTTGTINATGAVTTTQLVLDCGIINGGDGGGFNMISDNGIVNIFNGSSSVPLECSNDNQLTVGDGTTTGVIITSQLTLPCADFSGISGGGLNIIPDNGTMNLFNGSSSVPLLCNGNNSLVVGNGTTTGAITTSQITLACGTINGLSDSNFNFNVGTGSGIAILSPSGEGTLSVNSSNQLLWNGVVIS